MATASPTPVAAGLEHPYQLSSAYDFGRHQSRSLLKRNALNSGSKSTFSMHQQWKLTAGESSDDEMPVAPMKFSAAAKALLGDEASVMENASPLSKQPTAKQAFTEGAVLERRRSPLQSFSTRLRENLASPSHNRNGSPRIVRLPSSSHAPSTLQRSQSVRDDATSPGSAAHKELITPAPRARNCQNLSSHTRSGSVPDVVGRSASRTKSPAGTVPQEEPASNSREDSSIHEAAAQMETLSINRTRGEDTGFNTSQRQKRGLKITGRLLSGPARRGLKRRQSDEDESPAHEVGLSSAQGNTPSSGIHGSLHQTSPSRLHQNAEARTEHAPAEPQDKPRPSMVRFQSQASLVTGSPDPRNGAPSRVALTDSIENKPAISQTSSHLAATRDQSQPRFKAPPLPLLPSRYDQENEPPPTFKRNKSNGAALLEKDGKISIAVDDKMLAATPATVSPHRVPLAARSQNTPHRPAPPPPKMSVLDTATATAGAASASQARKKRNQYMSVNGRYFTRMDCIGRGGSSKVYRVMAENYKVFALKRVNLEDQDEMAIRGYKGEIDLLRTLENVDRVVRLFDFEINEEKHTLSVLMEMGESDLNRILTLRLNGEDAQFDITSTRYFWKEMLECVQAVHNHDIVHSDLKPANFLLLQGRLKLIDFGISNAIADDTVNVHREQHIGTPNYMSPEALIDSNAAAGLPASEGKMMKLGKPSDVWSLGCILYQMVYGKPPFAHIANQMQRIMAIPNPRHAIAFPQTGIGGVAIPAGLTGTLQRCLSRDQTQRPTVDELLAHGDPFLSPDVMITRETVPVGQDLIARLQHNIIKHVREKGIPSDAELATWPARFFASIKAAVEEGRA